MKKRYLLLILIPVLVGCSSNKDSSSTTTSTQNNSYTQEDYDILYNAVTFKSDQSFTGYRLRSTITNTGNGESIYNLTRFVYIDTEQNYYHIEQTETEIAADANGQLAKESSKTDIYYDQGSAYVLQADNSYKQTDGTVNRSSLQFKFDPKLEYLDNVNFVVNSNVRELEASVKPENANTVFNATGLETITDSKLTINVLDTKLEDMAYEYNLGDYKTKVDILMFYSAQNITLPEVR